MYTEYFGIDENPFSIAPDPRYLYMSRRHQEALAHLLYGVGEGGGFVLLTGEVGTGKTTICRCLMEQLPDTVDLALSLNPRLSAMELLASICDELGIEYPEGNTSQKLFVDLLNRHLLDAHAKGRRSVLVIDEAQNLSPEVLEQVRLLTNLETTKTKLLQIILIGQPELNELLGRNDMRQIAQRVTARFHLDPLGKEETKAYIRHRLAVVGLEANVFGTGAMAEIFKRSRGVPRLINNVCDRCLLGAYTQSKKAVDAKMVRAAAKEVLGIKKPTSPSSARPFLPWASAAVAFAAGVAFVLADPLGMGWKEKLMGPPGVVETVLGAPGNASTGATMTAEAGQVSMSDGRPSGESLSHDIPGVVEEKKVAAMAPPDSTSETAGKGQIETPETAGAPAKAPIVLQRPAMAETSEPPAADGDGAATNMAVDAGATEDAGGQAGFLPPPTGSENAEPTASGPPIAEVTAETTTVETAMATDKAPYPFEVNPSMETLPPVAIAGETPQPAMEAAAQEAWQEAVPAATTEASEPVVEQVSEQAGEPIADRSSEPPRKLAAAVTAMAEPRPTPPVEAVQQASLPAGGIDASAPITPDTLFGHPLVTGDLESALVSLFKRWRRQYLDIEGFAPCARAQNSGLNCLQGQGTWFSLYYLNRPALITLTSPEGKRIHTVVTAHTGSTVTLDLGGRQVVAETERLSPYWSGDFLMLWKPPSVYRREITLGHNGRDVVWVKNQLAEFRGLPIDDAPQATFDEDLRQKVIEFQGERLLKKDGIVGVRTMIHLNTVARDSRVPLLWNNTP